MTEEADGQNATFADPIRRLQSAIGQPLVAASESAAAAAASTAAIATAVA
jgi:hypothetical protein